MLVTFESEGALAHAQALTDVLASKPAAEVHPHDDHGITKTWTDGDIDAVVEARDHAREKKTADAAPQKAAPEPSASSTKTRRRRR
ncbi:hypothetical protein [Cupriavidus plantarum]|uniref:hypothetical protein n=1 Tax=Cupriavidus plantarum TaxID=942865 RepID=UPI00339D99C0